MWEPTASPEKQLIAEVGPNDFLLGRGRTRNTGNFRFRKWLALQYRGKYLDKQTTRSEKSLIIRQAILRWPGRFLERKESGYTEPEHESVAHNVVRHLLGSNYDPYATDFCKKQKTSSDEESEDDEAPLPSDSNHPSNSVVPQKVSSSFTGQAPTFRQQAPVANQAVAQFRVINGGGMVSQMAPAPFFPPVPPMNLQQQGENRGRNLKREILEQDSILQDIRRKRIALENQMCKNTAEEVTQTVAVQTTRRQGMPFGNQLQQMGATSLSGSQPAIIQGFLPQQVQPSGLIATTQNSYVPAQQGTFVLPSGFQLARVQGPNLMPVLQLPQQEQVVLPPANEQIVPAVPVSNSFQQQPPRARTQQVLYQGASAVNGATSMVTIPAVQQQQPVARLSTQAPQQIVYIVQSPPPIQVVQVMRPAQAMVVPGPYASVNS